MTEVILGLSSPEDMARRMRAAFSGEPQTPFIGFASAELLWSVMTTKRWDILKAMTGAGILSIREVARRVGRDIKAVHADVTALISAGIIDRTEAGVEFPYEAVHVDFTLSAA